MAPRHKYASYDPQIKTLIARTRNPDLFPHLNVPRTTALYWIEQGFEINDPTQELLAETITDISDRYEQTLRLLAESRAIETLLKEVFKNLGFRLNYRHINSKEIRDKILISIQSAMSQAKQTRCLEAVELSLSRYKRWKRERQGCGIKELKACPKYSRNQLTFSEITAMREFVTSPQYAHYPVRSLHHLAKREGILFCTYATWIKYINHYEWLRPRKKKRKKYERIGIRADQPNKIWHLDVSYFIFPDGRKAFIQAIIDNYSRYVLAWQVIPSYDGAKTGALLQKALQRSNGNTLQLMVDGGSENKGPIVRKLEEEGQIKKTVARFEISYSNSIVEALFRSLKHNYLFHQKIDSLKLLKKHTDFWFKEHNEKIPHTSFSGETPFERFRGSWKKETEIQIQLGHKQALKLRISHNQKLFCKLC